MQTPRTLRPGGREEQPHRRGASTDSGISVAWRPDRTSQSVAYGTSIDELLALSYPQPTDTVITLTSSDHGSWSPPP